jgi:MFS family permease
MKKIVILNILFRLLQGCVFFYLAIILKEFRFSGWDIGILLAMYSLTPLLISVPAGIMNDRIDSRVLISISCIGNGLFFAGLIFTKSFLPLLILFLLGGASNNFLFVSLQALALKITGEEKKGEKLGAFQGYAFMAYAMGLLAGGWLMTAGFSMQLLICGAALYGVLALYSMSLETTMLVNINALEYIKDFRSRDVIIFCLIYSVFAFHWGSEASSLSLFLAGQFSFSKYQIGLFMALPICFLGLSAVITGRIADLNRVDPRKFIVTAFLMSGLGQLLMVVPEVHISMLMRIIHEAGDGIAGLFFAIGLTRLFESSKLGGLSSMATFTNILASSLGALIFSRIGELYGYQYPMIAGGISALVACALMVTISCQEPAKKPLPAGVVKERPSYI